MLASFLLSCILFNGLFGYSTAALCEIPLEKICTCQTKGTLLDLECVLAKDGDLQLLIKNFPNNTNQLHLPSLGWPLTFPSQLLSSTSLKILRFTQGLLKEIEPEAFVKLPNLETLELIGNPKLLSLPKNLLADLPRLTSLTVFGSNLKKIDSEVLKNGSELTSLFLANLNLKSLDDNVFYDLKKLQSLDLASNDIQMLKSLTFNGLSSLQYLNLSYNINVTWYSKPFENLTNLKVLKLNSMFPVNTKLPAYLLSGLTSLQQLELNQNGFQEVPKVLLADVSSNLNQLALVYNNFTTLTAKSFDNFKALNVLVISDSHVSNINADSFVGLKSLKVLNLDGNRITHIGNNTFDQLPVLESLSLQNSEVKYLNPNSFAGLNNLIHLDLTKNLLETISVDVVRSISNAAIEILGGKVDDNPIKCNCSMLTLSRWLKATSKRIDIICYEPLKFATRRLDDISEEEFDCKDPTIDGCCEKTIHAMLQQDLSIACHAQGAPIPKVNFIVISGSPFPVNRTSYSDDGTELVISSVEPSDERVVQCRAENILASATMKFRIEVIHFVPNALLEWQIIVGVSVPMVFIFIIIGMVIWVRWKRRQLTFKRQYNEDDAPT